MQPLFCFGGNHSHRVMLSGQVNGMIIIIRNKTNFNPCSQDNECCYYGFSAATFYCLSE